MEPSTKLMAAVDASMGRLSVPAQGWGKTRDQRSFVNLAKVLDMATDPCIPCRRSTPHGPSTGGAMRWGWSHPNPFGAIPHSR